MNVSTNCRNSCLHVKKKKKICGYLLRQFFSVFAGARGNHDSDICSYTRSNNKAQSEETIYEQLINQKYFCCHHL